MNKLPKRSTRFGVGKEIGGAVYVHRSYINVFPEMAAKCLEVLDDATEYTVVKYAEKAQTVSFISSPDFDTANEPTIGDLATVKFDGTVKLRGRLSDPYIYHHKWLFVSDDYTGFSIEESKERSRKWLSLPDVDRQRIGRQSYWERYVMPRIEASEERWLSSKEMAGELAVTACELSRLRNTGKLPFRKQGNAFFYLTGTAQQRGEHDS